MYKVAIISNTFSSSFVFRNDYLNFLKRDGKLSCVISVNNDIKYVKQDQILNYNGIHLGIFKIIEVMSLLYKSDIIHSFTHIGNIVGYILAILTNSKIMATVTGRGRIYSKNNFQYLVLRKILDKIYFRIVKRGGTIIVQNKRDEKYFIEITGKPNQILRTNGSGLSKLEFRRLQKLSENKSPVIGFMSRALPEKGVDEFYELARANRSRNLIFRHIGHFGKGKYDEVNIQKTAKDSNIEYLNFTTNSFDEIKKIDIMIIPSSYYEGVSRLFIEAVCSGCMVIARRTPGVEDYENLFENLIIYDDNLSDIFSNCLEGFRAGLAFDTLPAFEVFDSRLINERYVEGIEIQFRSKIAE